MASASLSIGFAEQGEAPEILLEQADWGAYAGLLSRAGVARYVGHAVYGSGAVSGLVDCGASGGSLTTAILVFPAREAVRYRLLATAGTLAGPEYDEIEEAETVSYTLTTSARLTHPARRILDAEWLTGPWTTGGAVIAPPPLTADGFAVRANVVVYGSVRLKILVGRYRHVLRVSWDEAKALLNAGWSEYAICLPEGGRPQALAITPNRGAESMAASGADCGRVTFRVREDEGQWPPVCPPENKTIDCDYCSLTCDEGEEGDE